MPAERWVTINDVSALRRLKQGNEGVIVIRGPSGTRVHHPACPHVSEESLATKLEHGHGGYFWTDDPENAERRWASARRCRHPSDPLAGGTGGPEVTRRYQPTTAARDTAEWEVAGPSRDFRGVRAEAAWAIPYEPRSDGQLDLRAQLRRRLAGLVMRSDELLYATYRGPKPVSADIENLLLYNVDDSARCFVGGERGIRFDYAGDAPQDTRFPATYLYRPARRRPGLGRWRATRVIARWSGLELAAPPSFRLAAWFALRTGAVELGEPLEAAHPFAVQLVVHPPSELAAHAVKLVKPLIDASVGALQAHADDATAAAVADRLAPACGASSAELRALLLDPSRAVLGVRPRLFHLRSDGLQLAPGDEGCVAGEVLVEPSTGGAWTVDAEISAVEARLEGRGSDRPQ